MENVSYMFDITYIRKLAIAENIIWSNFNSKEK